MRWAIAIVLALAFVWVAAMNLWVLGVGGICRRRAPSWIPLVGGLSGAAAMLLAPVPGLLAWFWVPLLLDWGSAPGMAYTLAWHARRRHR